MEIKKIIHYIYLYLAGLDKASATKYLINEIKSTKSNDEMIEKYMSSVEKS